MLPERHVFPLRAPSNEGTIEVAVPRSPTIETLGEYIRRNRAGRPFSEIEENSARRGARVAASYIHRVENRIIQRPSNERLVAIGNGLGVPTAEILAVAAGRPLTEADAQDERLLTVFHALGADDRELGIKLIVALARARGAKAADVKQIKQTSGKKRRVA